MRGWNYAMTMSYSGWLLAACGPDKGQETSGTTEASGAPGSSGAEETGAVVVTTGGSSGGSGTTSTGGGQTDTGLDTHGESSGAPGTDGGLTTSAGGTTLVEETTGSGTTIGSTGDDTTTGGMMLIECNGCTCDPTVSYCQVTWSPTMDPPPEHPSGACPFIEAGSYNYGCVAYSQECGQDPSCDCVPVTEPLCGCMDAGPLLIVNCDYP